MKRLFNWHGFIVTALLAFSITLPRTASAIDRYVNLANSSPVAPFTNWTSAATSIQAAIDAAQAGDQIVVTNGVYNSGYTSTGRQFFAAHRVSINKPVSVVSVNGPAVTSIQGNTYPFFAWGMRGVYMTNGAFLSGFTVFGGDLDVGSDDPVNRRGGGILCESTSAVISNCVVTGNLAGSYGGGVYSGTLLNCTIGNNRAVAPGGARFGDGGGVYQGILKNCIVTNNSARVTGGGAISSKLENCLVIGNSALQGGGTWASDLLSCTVIRNAAQQDGQPGGGLGGGTSYGTAVNCIIVSNTEWMGGLGNWNGTALTNCCTKPSPGTNGNIDVDPMFADADGDNFRLLTGSLCRNAGNNDFVVGRDLDGAPRVVQGTIDIGAYEIQESPWLVTQPQSQAVMIGSNVIFSVFVIGMEPWEIKWERNGIVIADDNRISGSGTATITISNLVAADAGQYRAVVTNSFGAVTSEPATLIVLGPPHIFQQPVDATVPAGTDPTFTVGASGLSAVSYEWRFNGFPLSFATNSTLVLTNVQAPDSGDYDVVVTNSYGSITSVIAHLEVTAAPVTIVSQSTSSVVSLQQPLSLAIQAKGSEPFFCQWQKNGTNMPGATNLTFFLEQIGPTDRGTYVALISNAVSATSSAEISLSIVPIAIWGTGSTFKLNGFASATNVASIVPGGNDIGILRTDGTLVVAAGSSVFASATNLAGAALGGTPAISPFYVGFREDGTLVVPVSGGALVNVPAHVTNVVALAVASGDGLALRGDGSVVPWGQGRSGIVKIPSGASNIVAIATGSGHAMALRMDGKVIVWGSQINSAAIESHSNIVSIAAGGQQLAGLNNVGELKGWIATNTASGGAISYSSPPADATNIVSIAAGSNHTLGLHPDGTVMGWGNVPSLTEEPFWVTNVLAVGATRLQSFALLDDPSATVPPRIVRQPLDRTVKLGESVVIHSVALGTPPMGYQWFFGTNALPAQTNSWLGLTGLQPGDAGEYRLAVTNKFGEALSTTITLVVTLPPPLIKSPTYNPSGGVQFSFFALTGVTYVVEYKEQIDAPVWVPLFEIAGEGADKQVNDPTPLNTHRFYRLRIR